MADFNLLPVANRHTNTTRTEPPVTPNIKGNLFEDLLICVVLLDGVSTGVGGGASAGVGAAVELKKGYIS